MGQVYLESYTGPLYAYIEFRVANVSVVSTPEGYGLDHIEDYAKDDKYISNVVMSLAYQRKSASITQAGSGGGVGNTFTINVFDDSAVYIEDIIANALGSNSTGVNCYIEYGWAAAGKKIQERSLGINGSIKKYTISFEGPSTVLSVEGTCVEDLAVASTVQNIEMPKEISSSGNPSTILKHICDTYLSKNGVTFKYDSTTIDETVPVNINEKEIANYTLNNQTLFSYINNVLCPNAKTFNGQSGFLFWTKKDPNDPNTIWVYFKAQGSVMGGEYEVKNENGETIGSYSTGAMGSITREYNYYGNAQNNEVLSFSVDKEFMAPDASSGVTYSIDSNRNEPILGSATGSATADGSGSLGVSKRVFGLSSAAYNVLYQSMSDLWNKYSNQIYGATLEILGDAQINIMECINVNIFTKYGLLHHTSGKYIVKMVDDNVDPSGFTSTLTLFKESSAGSLSIEGVQEYSGGPAYNQGISSNSSSTNTAPYGGMGRNASTGNFKSSTNTAPYGGMGRNASTGDSKVASPVVKK